MTVLYITQNGVTDHIGRSQVAPYVLALARQGFRIHVLSAEKPGQEALIASYQQQFDQAGIAWTRVLYRNKPPLLGQAWTQAAMKRAATTIVKREGIKVIHCRSFPPALIAHRLKSKLDVKYIFDFRDFYVDGGLERTKGLTRLVYSRLKKLERPMIRSADKVICLTVAAKKVLIDWYLKDVENPEDRFKIIPCCADFSHFDSARLGSNTKDLARRKSGFQEGDFILIYLGSLGADYRLREMIALFRQVLSLRPNAKFLFLSNNGRELVEDECEKQHLALSTIKFMSVDREDVPSFIAIADMSVFFYRDGLRSIGCSPTKLAELFACNIPVVANSGIGDLDNIIGLQRNGSMIVHDFEDATLKEAAARVIAAKGSVHPSIRENSLEFALEEGVARYASVYQELLGQ